MAVFPLLGKTQVIKATLLEQLDGDREQLHSFDWKEDVSCIFIHCLMKQALWAVEQEWDEKKIHIYVTSSTLLLNQIDWTNKTHLWECSVHELWGKSHYFMWLSFCEWSDTCWQLDELNSGTWHTVLNFILNNICMYTHIHTTVHSTQQTGSLNHPWQMKS